jgi:hypothetical protein
MAMSPKEAGAPFSNSQSEMKIHLVSLCALLVRKTHNANGTAHKSLKRCASIAE